MKEAEEHNSFIFGDKKLKNLKDLIEVLENKDFEEMAKNHVTDEKNDFANWIKDVLKNEDLAYNVSQERELPKILEIIKKESETHEVRKAAESRIEEMMKNPSHLKEKEEEKKMQDMPKEEVKDDASKLNKEISKPKEVLKHAETRHFCPKFFDCTKKEFLFGFGLGIVVGIVIAVLMKAGAI